MFRVDVFRWALGDCTNSGISSKVDALMVLRPGEPVPSNPPPDLMREEKRGPDHYALIPVVQPARHCGPMFGGNLATTSNSAGNHAPGRVWKIHDRFETTEQYAEISQ